MPLAGPTPRTWPRRTLAVLIVALLTVVAVPQGQTVAADRGTVRLVVAVPDAADVLPDLLEDLAGGTVGSTTTQGALASLDMALVEVPADRVDELEADPRTAAVTLDVPLQMADAGFEGDAADGLAPALATIDADRAWAGGHTGRGVGVVLVDTGVNQHPDLDQDLVATVDLTAEQDGIDHYGHGTFLAGLVAGDGISSGGYYGGVAPDAHLVSVKVAGADGSTTLSQVLTGLAMADLARSQFDAPVVLLALAGPARAIPDPLMMASEMLWSRGSTVVVAAGNQGNGPGTITSPGVDPYLVTVGALDDAGTPEPDDDSVASFSSRGPTPVGHAKPDLIAPGVSTVGLRSPGSTIDVAHPDAVVDDVYFLGSGTSMAAALVAGAAATVLSADPALTPDHVKGRLAGGTADAPEGADEMAAGSGVLDVDDAVASRAPAANRDLPPLLEPAEHPSADPRAGESGRAESRAGAAPLAPAGWRWTGWRWTDDAWAGWRWTDDAWAGWRWTAADFGPPDPTTP